MKHDFNQRKERRIENAEQQAAKNQQESEQLFAKAKQMSSVIPFGQPILVGHHSEGRDRKYRGKIERTFEKSFEAEEKASYYENKAETIKNNPSIFSDDPQALEKLETKLKSLTELADFMKMANVCIRKKDKEGFLKLERASEQLWEELHSEKRFGGFGFAGFTLSNNSAERRRLTKRIEKLKNQSSCEAIDKVIGGVRLFEAGRLQLLFEGKPEAKTIGELKAHGFRWCRSEGAWQRHINQSAYYWAKHILKGLNQLQQD